MVSFTIETSHTTFKLTGPSSYKDVSCEMYLKLIEEWDGTDPFKAFSILYNIDYDTLINSFGDSTFIVQGLAFLYDKAQDLQEQPLPEFYKHTSGLMIKLSLLETKELTIGQHFTMRMRSANMPLEKCVVMAAAVVLQPIIDANDHGVPAKFNVKRAKELEEAMMKMPISIIFPIGYFFLMRRLDSGSDIINALNRPRILLMKGLKLLLKLLALPDYLKRMAILISLTYMQQDFIWTLMMYTKNQ